MQKALTPYREKSPTGFMLFTSTSPGLMTRKVLQLFIVIITKEGHLIENHVCVAVLLCLLVLLCGVCLLVCLLVCVFVCLCVCMRVCLLACVSACVSAGVCVCLRVCLSTCLSAGVCLSCSCVTQMNSLARVRVFSPA